MVLALLVVAALLVGGTVAALRFWPGTFAAIGPTPTPSAAESSATPSPETTPTPSATPSPSAKPAASATPASPAAIKAINACRDRAQAADEVLEQARPGAVHWKSHVDAERRAAEGTISKVRRQAIFKETRLLGPGDQKRYADAVRAYDDVKDASCGRAKGADSKVSATLAKCSKRASAQAPVMKAAAAVLGDWKQHLLDMQRSREQHNDDAQQVWLDAYKAAPPNINAYDKAVRDFKAPSC